MKEWEGSTHEEDLNYLALPGVNVDFSLRLYCKVISNKTHPQPFSYISCEKACFLISFSGKKRKSRNNEEQEEGRKP